MSCYEQKHVSNSCWAVLLLISIIVYTLKGFLYPTGIISVSVAIIELGLCCAIGVRCFKFPHKDKLIDVLFLICLIILISYTISPKEIYSSWRGEIINTFEFFREFCGAILPTFAIYYLVRIRNISGKVLECFFYIMFISSIIAFFYDTFTQMLEVQKAEITSNSSYRLIYLMPFIVMIKGNLKTLLLWIIAFVICLLSSKRGAIITITAEIFLFYWWKFKESRHKKIFITFFSILIIVSAYYLYEYYMNDMYFQMRVDDTLQGKTSGRDLIVKKILDSYSKLGLIKIIFGSGFANTVIVAGNYAHNDWVEILYDFGLLGASFYALFYIFLISSIKETKNENRRLLELLLIAFLMPSAFSMVFFSESSSIGFIWLGCALGMKDSIKRMHFQRPINPI